MVDPNSINEVITWVPSDVQPIEQRFAPWAPLSHEQPTELIRFLFPSDVKVTLQVQGQLRIGPTFGDEDTLVGGLRPIYQRVSEIVEEFATLPRVKG